MVEEFSEAGRSKVSHFSQSVPVFCHLHNKQLSLGEATIICFPGSNSEYSSLTPHDRLRTNQTQNNVSKSSRPLPQLTPAATAQRPAVANWNNSQLTFLSKSATWAPNQLHPISLIRIGLRWRPHTDRGPFVRTELWVSALTPEHSATHTECAPRNVCIRNRLLHFHTKETGRGAFIACSSFLAVCLMAYSCCLSRQTL